MEPSRRVVLAGIVGAMALGCTGMRREPDETPSAPDNPPGTPSGSPSGSPSGPRPAGRVDELRDRIGGRDRVALVVVPSGWQPGRPVILGAHGSDQTATTMVDAYRWRETCEARGWLGLFPTTPDGTTKGEVDDDWFGRVLDRGLSDHGADPERVFVAGFSGGGRRGYSFAAHHSRRIRAMAVHSGPMGHPDDEDPTQWDPRRTGAAPISLLHLHGRQDSRVPMDGGRLVPGVSRRSVPMREALEMWAEIAKAPMVRDPRPPPEVPSRCLFHRWEGPGGHLIEGVVDPTLGHEWAPYANELFAGFFERTTL